jgi:hypothetical protein
VILHHGCEVKTLISCHSHVDVDGHQYRGKFIVKCNPMLIIKGNNVGIL